MYFQIKVNQEGVIISDLGESSREIFAATTHAVVISIFSCTAHFTKFTHGSSLLMEKSTLLENQKQKEVLSKKKKGKKNKTKQNRPK